MTSWVNYGSQVSALERMTLNDAYWEEQYARSKKLSTDESSFLLKICPTCGWSGRTGLTLCQRKEMHSHAVKLNIVPKEKEHEVLL